MPNTAGPQQTLRHGREHAPRQGYQAAAMTMNKKCGSSTGKSERCVSDVSYLVWHAKAMAERTRTSTPEREVAV